MDDTVNFNAPPNWPQPPAGWTPSPGWSPDPAWGPAPEGWQFWTPDEAATELFPRPKKNTKRPVVLAMAGGAAGAVALILAALFVVGSAVNTGDSPRDDAEPAAVAAQPTPSASETPAAHDSYIDYVRGETDYFAHHTGTALVDEGLQYCERYEAGADQKLISRELKLAYMNPGTEEWADASIYTHTGSTRWLCPEHEDPVGPKAPWTASTEYWGNGPHKTSPTLDENFVAAQRAKAGVGNASLGDEEILRQGRTVCTRLESGASPRSVLVELLLEYSGQTDGETAAGFLLPTAVYAFCPQFEDAVGEMTE